MLYPHRPFRVRKGTPLSLARSLGGLGLVREAVYIHRACIGVSTHRNFAKSRMRSCVGVCSQRPEMRWRCACAGMQYSVHIKS